MLCSDPLVFSYFWGKTTLAKVFYGKLAILFEY